MASGDTYILKSASFGSAITGCTNYTITKGGSPVDLVGDASEQILDVFIDNGAYDFVIDVNNAGSIKGFEVGDSASLVLILQKRATGRGGATGSDIVITAADAVVVSANIGAPHEGNGSGSVSFRAPVALFT